MANLRRKPAPVVAPIAAPVEECTPAPMRLMPRCGRDVRDLTTGQMFVQGVPTVAEPYSEWMRCQVAAGLLEVV